MPLSCQKCTGGMIRKCNRCGHIFCGNCEKSGAACPLCGDNSTTV